MNRRPDLRAALAAALLLALSPATLTADWLVSRQGERVETRGPWTVKGNLVVFHQPNGTLSSLRLAEVDLDASAAATAKAVEPPPAPAAPAAPRQAVLVLTEKDLPPVDEEEEAAAAAPAGEKPAAAPNEPLVVSDWQRVVMPDGVGVQIVGTVTNQGGAIATGGTVMVSLYDDTGAVLVTDQAELPAKPISPGQATTFTAEFPGMSGFADAKFAVSSRGFRLPQPAPQTGEGAPAATAVPATPKPEGDGAD